MLVYLVTFQSHFFCKKHNRTACAQLINSACSYQNLFDMAPITSTSKSLECKKCSIVIATGVAYIGCEGFCKRVFHAACVKLSHEDVIQYRNKASNFWWICTQCMDAIRYQRDHLKSEELDGNEISPKETDISRIDGEISELKKEIASLRNSIVHSTVSHVEASTTETTNEHRPLAESSLLSMPDDKQSTNSTGRRDGEIEQRNPNDRFWLFFTRVKNCTTEGQILKVVADSLGTNDAIVKILVPPWKDALSMPYVSFKVGVNARLKETALRPCTWPTGLRYREFRDDVWEPL